MPCFTAFSFIHSIVIKSNQYQQPLHAFFVRGFHSPREIPLPQITNTMRLIIRNPYLGFCGNVLSGLDILAFAVSGAPPVGPVRACIPFVQQTPGADGFSAAFSLGCGDPQ
jgi:hypothetical protein